MKLQQLTSDPNVDARLIADLENLLRQPSYHQARPCPGCTKPCVCGGSPTCTCECGPECPDAPKLMTSDPEYPIEPQIASLVFAFSCLRVLPPYWSCEGHLFPNGEIHRVPQVWFYSRSMIYPKLVSDYLRNLDVQKKLQNPWHICLTFTDNSLEVGFSIEPNSKVIQNPKLYELQQDVKKIAANFCEGVRDLARRYLRNCR